MHETNEPITRTKRKRTENEKRTNDTRKRNEWKTPTIRNICQLKRCRICAEGVINNGQCRKQCNIGYRRRRKQCKNTTQYVLGTTMWKSHAIRGITSYKMRRFNNGTNRFYMYFWLFRGIHSPNTVYSNVNK